MKSFWITAYVPTHEQSLHFEQNNNATWEILDIIKYNNLKEININDNEKLGSLNRFKRTFVTCIEIKDDLHRNHLRGQDWASGFALIKQQFRIIVVKWHKHYFVGKPYLNVGNNYVLSEGNWCCQARKVAFAERWIPQYSLHRIL